MGIKNLSLESYIDLFFDESPIPQAIVDSKGNLIKVNESFSKLLGYTILELTKKNFQSITHPDDLEAGSEMYKGCLNGDFDGYSMVKRYLNKSGYTVWVKIDIRLIKEDDSSFFVKWVTPLPNSGRFKVEAAPNDIVVKPVIKLSDIVRDNLKAIITIGSILLMSLGGAIVTFVKMASSLNSIFEKLGK